MVDVGRAPRSPPTISPPFSSDTLSLPFGHLARAAASSALFLFPLLSLEDPPKKETPCLQSSLAFITFEEAFLFL